MDECGPITPERLRKCHQVRTVHMKLAKGGSAFGFRCAEHPRWTWQDWRDTGRDKFQRTMMVDGVIVRGLEAVAAALNRTPEENERMADELELTGGSGEKKWSLHDGITEVKREQFHRGRVYPRLVGSGQLTQADANKQNWALQGALTFLEFCLINETDLKEFMVKKLAEKAKGKAA